MRQEGPSCVSEMPKGGNTAKEVERGVSLKNQQKPLKCVPFIFKPFPVWRIACKVHKTAGGSHPRCSRELTPVLSCWSPKEGGEQL